MKLISKTLSLNFVKLPYMQKFNITNLLHHVPTAALTFSTITVKLHSLMQALATPSSTVHNTKYLDTYHESISGLAARIRR